VLGVVERAFQRVAEMEGFAKITTPFQHQGRGIASGLAQPGLLMTKGAGIKPE